MSTPMTAEAPTPETTDLERRVLAHERILQALIAYMSRTEPRFIDHLTKRFVEPTAMTSHEPGQRETDDAAEEFVRAVIRFGATKEAAAPDTTAKRESPAKAPKRSFPWRFDPSVREERVTVRNRSGVWEVRVDGVFRGDYHREDHARTAEALLKSSSP
jgi:hypothetical protein